MCLREDTERPKLGRGEFCGQMAELKNEMGRLIAAFAALALTFDRLEALRGEE